MWPSRLFWKLFLVIAGLNLVLALGFLAIVSDKQEDLIWEQVEQRLFSTALALRGQVRDLIKPNADRPPVHSLEGQWQQKLQERVAAVGAKAQTRITVIAADGVVLADSDKDPASMENHGNRPEVLEARRAGQGVERRLSNTLKVNMFYLAIPVNDRDWEADPVVRVALKIDWIEEQVSTVQGLLWTLALVVGGLAILLTYMVVGRLIRPIGKLKQGAEAIAMGEYQHRVAVRSGDELGSLAEAFNHMGDQLASHVDRLGLHGERLSTVLGSMVEGVLAVDADENILLANQASMELLEMTMRDVVGRPLREVTRTRHLHDAVARALNYNESCQTEFGTLGQPRRVLALRAAPLPSSPSPGVVVVLHDVSELRRLENLRSEFVANVSHELKTPLSAIKAYAETLRLGAVDDPDNNLDFVHRIEAQANRLHQLIVDLLHLARVESGREALDLDVLSLTPLVEASVNQFATAAAAKEISVELVPANSPVSVQADPAAVRTILENLIDNAIKYTPPKSRVAIRWEASESVARITIQDNGVGIESEDQERVFERFYRVDQARSRELGGTGLGLAIVKHVTQAMGGSVELISTPGEGTTFCVCLPLGREGEGNDE